MGKAEILARSIIKIGRSSPPSRAIRPDRQRLFASGALRLVRIAQTAFSDWRSLLCEGLSGCYATKANMDQFVRSQNVERYRHLLERVPDESNRQHIINLLHSNDAPTRMVRRGYFGAVARTFGVAAARRRCDRLFIFGQLRSQSAIGC
jgi:hypothetical protein